MMPIGDGGGAFKLIGETGGKVKPMPKGERGRGEVRAAVVVVATGDLFSEACRRADRGVLGN